MTHRTFEWDCSLGEATVRSLSSGIRIQIDGKPHQPDRIETNGGSDNGTNKSTCHFSQAGLALRVTVKKAGGRVALSGVLHSRSDNAVYIEQMWFGECLVDLGGPAEDYRIYYNSGCQEASGTCRLSAIRGAAAMIGAMVGREGGDDHAGMGKDQPKAAAVKAYTDPDDPDALGAAAMPLLTSTCIQPEGIGSRYVTAVYCKDTKTGVCLGGASFARAETVFFVKPGPTDTSVKVSPVILYNNLQLDPDATLAVEEIAVHMDRSPLTAMERYVEQVATEKNLVLKPLDEIAGLWNYWMAFSEEENNAGADLAALKYQRANLLSYGIRSMPVGVVWHKDNAFFESRCKPHLGASLAEAVRREAERFPEGDYCGGLFWGAASECSDFFRQHPEAILRDKEGRLCGHGPEGSASWTRCPSPAYWVDFSHPAAREFFKAHLRSLDGIAIRTYNLDFMGDHGDWKGAWNYFREEDNPYLTAAPHDAHVNRPFETDRVILQTLRETLGPDVVTRSYTAPFLRYLGLIDVVRTATDHLRVEYGGRQMPVDWDWLRGLMQNLAANYMFHGKWWWADACAICVGTQVVPERTEEFRVRSLMAFITGGPITLGDKIAQMVPEQFRYYTINLPPTGHAARPLDFFDRALPELYHFPKSRTGFDHDLLTVMNLSDAPRNYEIQLADLGLDGDCLAFEFWTRELIRIADGMLKVTVPPFACRHYALHRDRGVPQVVGTDFHLSMGAAEIRQTQWDEKAQVLRGTIRRPAKETGRVYVSVPARFNLNRTNVVGARIGSLDKVIALDVEASSEPVAWQLSF